MSRGNGPSGDIASILLGIVMVGGLLWLYAGMSQPATTVVQPYPTATHRSSPTPTATPLYADIPVVPSLASTGIVNRDSNLRAGPGLDHQVMRVAPAGERVTIVGANADQTWLMLDTEVWIAAFLVSQESTSRLPAPVDITDDSDYQSDRELYEEELRYEATAEAGMDQYLYEQWLEEQAELGLSDCTCTGNAYNCVDFAAGNDAQACYQHCLDVTGVDVHWLDDDRDGSACDWSPRE
jgi:hypothetical protein